MSIKARAWAQAQPIDDFRTHVLLETIADYASDDGTCWPSQATLAKRCHCTERTVRRLLVWLEKHRYISRESRGSHKGGRSSDRYALPAEARDLVTGQNDRKPKSTRVSGHLVSGKGGELPDISEQLPDIAMSGEPSLEPPIVKKEVAVSDAAADAHELYKKLTEAANGALHPLAIGLASVGEPLSWLKEGADLDVDVLPVVRAISARVHLQRPRSISSWGYFAGAVADAKARRERGLPQALDLPAAGQPTVSEVLAKMRADREAGHGR